MSNLGYEEWAERLYEFFFSDENAGGEILFAVDGATLQEIYPEGGTAAAGSFSEVVAGAVRGSDWKVSRIVNRVWLWEQRGQEGAHPALPLLALTVLAASNMEGGGSVAGTNYYVPLRRLVDPNDSGHGAPGDFTSHIEDLWESVEEWSAEHLGGRYGVLRARSQTLRFVGLALQHAFLRASDLRHLNEFFRRLGLEPEEDLDIDPATLRRAVQAWVAGRNEGWAERLQDACKDRLGEDKELESHCERLLVRELRRWDGRPRDPRTGRALGQIRLVVSSLKNPRPYLQAKWDERLAHTQDLDLPQVGSTKITRVDELGYYAPTPLPGIAIGDLEEVLTNGLDVVGSPTHFQFEEADLYALRYDDDIAAWSSVDHVSYGEPHVFVAQGRVSTELTEFLAGLVQEGGDPPTRTSMAQDGQLVDWWLVGPSRIDGRPARIPDALAPFLPAGSGPRLRLLGGLKVGLAIHVYLRGGEPAVGLSNLETLAEWIVIENTETGSQRKVCIGPDEDEVYLSQLNLEPGNYTVRQGGAEAKFTVVDGIEAMHGPGAGDVLTEGVEGTIAPTHTPAVRPHMAEIKRNRPTYLLGSSSDEHEEVWSPRWLAHDLPREGDGRPWLSWDKIDAWISFDPVWQVLPGGRGGRGGSGRATAQLIHPREPIPGEVVTDTKWAKRLREAELRSDASDEEEALWNRYQERVGVR